MKYYFDTNARIQAWIEAEDKEKASDTFAYIMSDTPGLKITLDTYQPVKEEE